jgi:hypothetical protein
MYVCHFEDDNRHFLLVSIETILETFGAGLQQTFEIVSFVSAEKVMKKCLHKIILMETVSS